MKNKYSSYSFLSSSLNKQLSVLVAYLMHSTYNYNLYKNILNLLVDDDITNKANPPISIEAYLSFKIIQTSAEVTSSASYKWILESDFKRIHEFFEVINYDEIGKLEASEKDEVSKKLQQLAKKGDLISSSYESKCQEVLIKHLDECTENAYTWYNDSIDDKTKIIELAVAVCDSFSKKENLDLKVEANDTIFMCRTTHDLIDYADYFHIIPENREPKWLIYHLSWGNNIIEKFYNISISLMLLAAIKRQKAAELDTSSTYETEAGIKKLGKFVHKNTKETFKQITDDPEYQQNNLKLDSLTDGMQEIHQNMMTLLHDVTHSNIPVKHSVSEEDAANLDDKTGV